MIPLLLCLQILPTLQPGPMWLFAMVMYFPRQLESSISSCVETDCSPSSSVSPFTCSHLSCVSGSAPNVSRHHLSLLPALSHLCRVYLTSLWGISFILCSRSCDPLCLHTLFFFFSALVWISLLPRCRSCQVTFLLPCSVSSPSSYDVLLGLQGFLLLVHTAQLALALWRVFAQQGKCHSRLSFRRVEIVVWRELLEISSILQQGETSLFYNLLTDNTSSIHPSVLISAALHPLVSWGSAGAYLQSTHHSHLWVI